MKRQLPKPKSADALSLVEAASEPPAAQKSVHGVNGRLFPDSARSGWVCGSKEESFTIAMIEKTLNASISMSDLKEGNEVQKLAGVIVTALGAFDAQDEIEGMITAQAVALHFGAMEALRRSMVTDQPSEVAARLRKDGANMARAMVDMVEALDRKRGKAQQVVRVERVVVEDGGQAIVGTVNAGPTGTGGRA